MEHYNNLTEKHQMFCVAFVQSLNYFEAYKQIYGDQASRSKAHRLFNKPEIKAAIQELLAEYVESKLETLSRVQSIISFDLLDFWNGEEVDFQKLKKSGFGWLVKGWRKGKSGQEFLIMDKDRALEQLAKIQGLYSDSAIQNNYFETLNAETELNERIKKIQSKIIPN